MDEIPGESLLPLSREKLLDRIFFSEIWKNVKGEEINQLCMSMSCSYSTEFSNPKGFRYICNGTFIKNNKLLIHFSDDL